MAEENLDALCDLLDDDDSFDEEISNMVDEEVANVDANPPQNLHAVPQSSSSVSEMEQKLKAMQEEMTRMQEKLAEAKKSSNCGEEEAKPQPAKKSLSEIDVFQSSSRSQSDAPSSPVKTNPFAHHDKPQRLARLHAETPQFGPSLAKKSTRVLSGEDKLKFQREVLKSNEEKAMAAIAAKDLADSSDEDNEDRDPMTDKYSSYGKEIKRLSKVTSEADRPPLGFNKVVGSSLNLSNSSANKALPKNLLVEKHSRMRISNPLVNQISLDLSLMGRKMIPMHRLKSAIVMKETDGDWTTIGAIFYKATQKSKNGNTFTIWKMTDLLGDIQVVSVLLFGKANTKHYSMPTNRVVGLLNPKILEDRTGKGELSLSIDHPDKVMEIGEAIDCGKCKARKADGGSCTNLVNLNSCEYCAYHVKRAYQSISSKRSELQSSFSGDARSRIMAKVAPKGEVFGGGQILNQRGLPGKKAAKNVRKDNATLASLGVVQAPVASASPSLKKKPSRLSQDSFFQPETGKVTYKSQLSQAERTAVKKVASSVSEELGMKLLAPTPGSRLLMSHLTRKDQPVVSRDNGRGADLKDKLKSHQNDAKMLLMQHKNQMPKLGRGLSGGSGGFITLDSGGKAKASQAAALLTLKGKSLKKADPNYVMRRKRTQEELDTMGQRVAASLDPGQEGSKGENAREDGQSGAGAQPAKKAKVVRSFTGEVIDEQRMAELRNKRSVNHNLANVAELEEEERYFDRQEKKEAMEEKMINTMELEAKVVTCSVCKYTSYTQSELCKTEGHQVKRIKAKKKFFECKNCKRRTFCFDKYPKFTCTNCKGSAWVRTGMMKERTGPLLDSEKLLIRGREEKFIGATIKSADLNIDL